MVEGSLWVYGHTRLGDYYAGGLSLRELASRFFCLPPEAPVWRIAEAEREKAAERDKAHAVESALARFKPERG